MRSRDPRLRREWQKTRASKDCGQLWGQQGWRKTDNREPPWAEREPQGNSTATIHHREGVLVWPLHTSPATLCCRRQKTTVLLSAGAWLLYLRLQTSGPEPRAFMVQ
jgi:hypothetical protein